MNGRSRTLCYRAGSDADHPRQAAASSTLHQPPADRAWRIRPPPHPHRHPDHRPARRRPVGRRGDGVHRGRLQLLRARACPTRSRSSRTSSSSSRRSCTTGPARSSWRGSARFVASVVSFAGIPDETLDATTAIEDQFFWTNPGFDPSASSARASTRCPAGRVAPPRSPSSWSAPACSRRRPSPISTYERKIREIIQSIRLTEAYPGDKGKQDIITAYLNQNFYGNHTYGVKAAAKGYFGKALDELTLAQNAILAAIPQSPTKFDLMRNAEEVCLDDPPPDPESEEICKETRLQVPASSEIVAAPQLRPRPDEDAQPTERRPPRARGVRRGQARARHHQAPGRGHLARAAFRVAGPRSADRDRLPGDTDRLRARSIPAATG